MTLATDRADREMAEHRRIDRSIEYVARHRLCISCKTRPVVIGMTCGGVGCIRKWLKIRHNPVRRPGAG
jgi:hypothetical protein